MPAIRIQCNDGPWKSTSMSQQMLDRIRSMISRHNTDCIIEEVEEQQSL